MRQKKKPQPEVVTIEHLYRIGNRIIDTQHRSLFFALYLTGARISEMLDTERKDFYIENHNGYNILFVKLITLKRKEKYIRVVPIHLDLTRTDEESAMAQYLLDYLRPMHPDQKPWTFTRKTAWKYFRIPFKTRTIIDGEYIRDYEFLMHPHYLRHARLTHLVQYYGFSDAFLVQWTGWSNAKPAQIYVNLNVGSLVEKMIEKGMMNVQEAQWKDTTLPQGSLV